MFYSHTFLAKKSPLGTVWIAAHLQRQLRKNHILDTNIPSSVDYIMFSEVPIALRLSGHLLLGVVRIYSKKVEYLLGDCNDALKRIKTAFASPPVDLPENETKAAFESITLPDKFELDAMDISFDDRVLDDDHVTNPKDITLIDYIPPGRDPYDIFGNEMIVISPAEPANYVEERTENRTEDTPTQVPDFDIRDSVPEIGASSVQADNEGEDFSVPGAVNHVNEVITEKPFEDTPNPVPEIELLRHAVVDDDIINDIQMEDVQPDKVQEEIINEETISPIIEDDSGRQFAPPELHRIPSIVATSSKSLGSSSNNSLGNLLPPEMAIIPTPVEVKNVRSRKRKQMFDESVVLNNEFMKEGLKDSSKLVSKRRKLPCSALDVWKFKNRSRKEQVFLEPSISGLNTNLQSLFKKETFRSKLPLPQSSSPVPDPLLDTNNVYEDLTPVPDLLAERSHQYPPPNANMDSRGDPVDPVPENFSGIERPRFADTVPSPPIREEFTPILPSSSVAEPQTDVLPTEINQTVEQSVSTAGYEMETPITQPGEYFDNDNTGLSSIPEFPDSAEADDLCFLEADNTPDAATGYKEREESDALSSRTRAVAEFLKKKSPETGISKEQAENLSLDKILAGKTRKQCARMFYETTVLKSFDLIDVHQEKAYGDITLSLTSKLVRSKF